MRLQFILYKTHGQQLRIEASQQPNDTLTGKEKSFLSTVYFTLLATYHFLHITPELQLKIAFHTPVLPFHSALA